MLAPRLPAPAPLPGRLRTVRSRERAVLAAAVAARRPRLPPPARPPLSAPSPSPLSSSQSWRRFLRLVLPAPALPPLLRLPPRRPEGTSRPGGHTVPPKPITGRAGGGPPGWLGSPPTPPLSGSPRAASAAGRVSEERGRSALGADPPSSPLCGVGAAFGC